MLHSVRNTVARRLVRWAYRVASDEGWALEEDRLGLPSMLAGLSRLRRRGAAPMAVIDVGACVGDWTRLLLKAFPEARVMMIEPQKRHADRLTALCQAHQGRLQFEGALVGPPGKNEATFYVTDDAGAGTGSSVLPENSDVPRHRVSLPMTTLDALIEKNGFPSPDLIKLDVQGYELEVLKGAEIALSRAEFALLEVSFWPYNEGGPLMHDVVAWMQCRGFRAYDIFDLSRRPDGVLVQVDLLFVREDSMLIGQTKTTFGASQGALLTAS